MLLLVASQQERFMKGAWGAPSVKGPTLHFGSGHDLLAMGSLGSSLSVEPA